MPKSQITVEAVENKTVSGSKADYAALKLLFPGSPLYTDYTKEYLDANKKFEWNGDCGFRRRIW